MDGFELLQLASLETDLPFILISADARLNVMMRGFSLGAIDYLIKPLRIEDLRYVWVLWMHIAKTRLSVKEAPECMKHDTLAIEEPKSSPNSKKRKVAVISADARLNVMMRGFSLGATDYLMKPLRIEDLRCVWILWKHIAKTRLSDKEAPKCMKHDTLAIEEPKSSSNSKKRKVAAKLNDDSNDDNSDDESDNDDSSSSKRTCLVWTTELHQKFLSSVNQIGTNKAVPKQILELMNVPGITRENVASHLQKYRLHLRKLSQAKQNEFLRVCSGEAVRTGQQKSLNFPALCGPDQIPAQTLASLEYVILGRSSRSLSVPPQWVIKIFNMLLCKVGH